MSGNLLCVVFVWLVEAGDLLQSLAIWMNGYIKTEYCALINNLTLFLNVCAQLLGNK